MTGRRRALAAALGILTITSLCLESHAESILRLHVIANSDSAQDQQIKLLVRDALLDTARACLNGCNDAAQAQTELMEHGNLLIQTARSVLREQDVDYDVALYMGEYPFPERNYGGEIYPAGSYQALRVVLGNGTGQNWWCVMFPDLCLISLDEEQQHELSRIRGRVHFKSLFLELWKRWNRS